MVAELRVGESRIYPLFTERQLHTVLLKLCKSTYHSATYSTRQLFLGTHHVDDVDFRQHPYHYIHSHSNRPLWIWKCRSRTESREKLSSGSVKWSQLRTGVISRWRTNSHIVVAQQLIEDFLFLSAAGGSPRLVSCVRGCRHDSDNQRKNVTHLILERKCWISGNFWKMESGKWLRWCPETSNPRGNMAS